MTRSLPTASPRHAGLCRRTSEIFLYLGAALVLVLATLVSSFKKKPGLVSKPKDAVAAPAVQDNTANNVAALHAQLNSEHQRQQEDALAAQAMAGTPAQQAAGSAYGPNGLPVTGTPCVP